MRPDSLSSPAPSRLFIIAPAYNESESLKAFAHEIHSICYQHFKTLPTSLVIVDDGSTDATGQTIQDILQQPFEGPFHVIGVHLSKNFGHQAALHAGLSFAFAESDPDSYFILMDADFQHPPSLIPRIVETLRHGNAHVQMVRDDSRSSDGFLKPFFSRIFYRFFGYLSGLPLPPGSSDFRGLRHAVAKAFLDLPEVDRFNRGLFWWVGSTHQEIPYTVGKRAAGRSKYGWVRMLSLACTGITSFSSVPLTLSLGMFTGLAFLFCFFYFLYECYQLFVLKKTFSIGWPSLVFLITFWGGLLSLGQLLLGIYISKIFHESKARPSFLIKSVSRKEQTPPA